MSFLSPLSASSSLDGYNTSSVQYQKAASAVSADGLEGAARASGSEFGDYRRFRLQEPSILVKRSFYTVTDFLNGKKIIGSRVEDKGEEEETRLKKQCKEDLLQNLAEQKKATESIKGYEKSLKYSKLKLHFVKAFQISLIAIAAISVTALILMGTGAISLSLIPISTKLMGTVFATSSIIGLLVMPWIYMGIKEDIDWDKERIRHSKIQSKIIHVDRYSSESDSGLKANRKRMQKMLSPPSTKLQTKPSDEELAASLAELEKARLDYFGSPDDDKFMAYERANLNYQLIKKSKARFDMNPDVSEIYYLSNFRYPDEDTRMFLQYDLYEDQIAEIEGINSKLLKELFYLRLQCTNLVLMIDSLKEPDATASNDYKERYALLKAYRTSSVGQYFDCEDQFILQAKEKLEQKFAEKAGFLAGFDGADQLTTESYLISFSSYIGKTADGDKVIEFDLF
jgi:hypothetical protein